MYRVQGDVLGTTFHPDGQDQKLEWNMENPEKTEKKEND